MSLFQRSCGYDKAAFHVAFRPGASALMAVPAMSFTNTLLASATTDMKKRHKSAIANVVDEDGGPVHDRHLGSQARCAPTGGEFKPIATTADGVEISEHMPLMAKEMKHVAVVRLDEHPAKPTTIVAATTKCTPATCRIPTSSIRATVRLSPTELSPRRCRTLKSRRAFVSRRRRQPEGPGFPGNVVGSVRR